MGEEPPARSPALFSTLHRHVQTGVGQRGSKGLGERMFGVALLHICTDVNGGR